MSTSTELIGQSSGRRRGSRSTKRIDGFAKATDDPQWTTQP